MSTAGLEIWVSHSRAQSDWVGRVKANCKDYRLLSYITDNGYDRNVGEKLIELSRLIAQSPGRVVVLSEDYFKSARCMEELALICARNTGNALCLVLFNITDFNQLVGTDYQFAEIAKKCCLAEAVPHHWKKVKPKLTSAEQRGYSLTTKELREFLENCEDSVQVRIDSDDGNTDFVVEYAVSLSLSDFAESYQQFLFE